MFAHTARVLCLLLMAAVIASPGIALAQPQYPSNQGSISIGPTNAQGSPGQVVSFHVGVSARNQDALRPSYSGSVLVTVPKGLTVVGSPVCGSGCGQVFVEQIPEGGTKIEASIQIYNNEQASFSFRVMIDMSARVGAVYSLQANLLGGFVSTSGWMSVATLTVVDATPARGASKAFNSYISVTPESLRIAPSGSTLYYIQPVFLFQMPDASANMPDYTVRVELPRFVILRSDPICGPRQPNIPGESSCEIDAELNSDGSTIVTSRPGFVEMNSNGLYIPVEIEKSAPVGSVAAIEVSMRVTGEVAESEQHRDVTASILITDPSEISMRDSSSGTLSGLIEVQQGFVQEGDSCATDYLREGTELAVYSDVSAAMLSHTSVQRGRVVQAGDATKRHVCVFGFSFNSVTDYSVYVVTYMPEDGNTPCRACVLGLLTSPTRDGMQAIVEARGRAHQIPMLAGDLSDRSDQFALLDCSRM